VAETTVEESVRRIEKDLGLKEGFLEGLRREDDWSFIIKTHALFEAAIAHLLCKALGRDELIGVLGYLELSDKRRGKVAFADALGLLQKTDKRFLSSLSELRNELVHDITNANFDLRAYLQSLSADGFAAFVKNFDSFSGGKDVTFRDKSVPASEVFREDPKTGFFWSACVTLSLLYEINEIKRLAADAAAARLVTEVFRRLTAPETPAV